MELTSYMKLMDMSSYIWGHVKLVNYRRELLAITMVNFGNIVKISSHLQFALCLIIEINQFSIEPLELIQYHWGSQFMVHLNSNFNQFKSILTIFYFHNLDMLS